MIVTPLAAPQIAAGSVTFVREKFGFELLYTPESLVFVDAIVDKIRQTGATEQQASGLLSGLGCYAGEVFVRHARASWRSTADMGVRGCRVPVILALPGPIACDPIGLVFERFALGDPHSVAQLFEAALPPKQTEAPARRA